MSNLQSLQSKTKKLNPGIENSKSSHSWVFFQYPWWPGQDIDHRVSVSSDVVAGLVLGTDFSISVIQPRTGHRFHPLPQFCASGKVPLIYFLLWLQDLILNSMGQVNIFDRCAFVYVTYWQSTVLTEISCGVPFGCESKKVVVLYMFHSVQRQSTGRERGRKKQFLFQF